MRPNNLWTTRIADPDRPEALAEARRHLYLNPDVREAIAAAGSRAVEPFDADCVAAQFVSATTLTPY